MHQAGIDAQRAQPVQCRVEALFLFAGLLANGGNDILVGAAGNDSLTAGPGR